LWQWRYRTYLDEAKSNLFEPRNGLAVLVETGGESDWMTEVNAAKFRGLKIIKLLQPYLALLQKFKLNLGWY
jgi:hypothetical protein